jgi:integrase/recombinase XerD
MPDAILAPSFSKLVQGFFAEHLVQQRALSPRTVAAYRDTFRLLLTFAEQTTGKSPTSLQLTDLNANLVLAFLDHIEQVRNNGVRSRNARLAAVRSFLKYAAHHDVSALHVIQQTMAVPTKRFDRPMLGFLTRDEMQAILEAPDAESWAGQRDRVLFAMLYNTGARVSEVINIRAKDAILDSSPSVHILGKGRKHRTVPLLGHESTATTHIYVEADLAMKERALSKLQSPAIKPLRYRPPDRPRPCGRRSRDRDRSAGR